jgi:hypothetical protein
VLGPAGRIVARRTRSRTGLLGPDPSRQPRTSLTAGPHAVAGSLRDGHVTPPGGSFLLFPGLRKGRLRRRHTVSGREALRRTEGSAGLDHLICAPRVPSTSRKEAVPSSPSSVSLRRDIPGDAPSRPPREPDLALGRRIRKSGRDRLHIVPVGGAARGDPSCNNRGHGAMSVRRTNHEC